MMPQRTFFQLAQGLAIARSALSVPSGTSVVSNTRDPGDHLQSLGESIVTSEGSLIKVDCGASIGTSRPQLGLSLICILLSAKAVSAFMERRLIFFLSYFSKAIVQLSATS